MEIEEIEKYTKHVIPNLEKELLTEKDPNKLLELYNLYEDILCLMSPYDFSSFNKYLEFEEDKSRDNVGFHHHRKEHMFEVHNTLNQMETYDKYDVVLISLPPRCGKEQPLNSNILTPNGWKTMGDMKVGQKVIGEDGLPYNVTGVFPQGRKDVYEVTFDDNTKVQCGLEHLWEVQTRDDRRGKKSRVVTTEKMMSNLYVEDGKRKNYSIKYVEPMDFNDELKLDDIHPYLLGVLIGDGSLTNGARLTNVDEDVLSRVRELLPKGEVMNRVSDTITYDIKDKVMKRTKNGHPIPCQTLSKIRQYGLDLTSKNAFIPSSYLQTTKENRLELLKGLMDSDGYKSNGSYNEFTTTSEKLASDFIELVRSLGGRITMSDKIGSYVKDGVRHNCSKVYRLAFNMELNPFYCSRKSETFVPRNTRNYKYITSIELVGNEQCQCIMVDNPNHLYVTDGYNITHNTTYSIRFLAWIMGKYADYTQLGTSYSDNITSSFYAGLIEIVTSERYHNIYPDTPLVNQNAKRQEIWLKTRKRYPTIGFVPVGGSVTGRGEANNYLYVDDLVSGQEEAMSPARLDKLWDIFTANFYQRKKNNCKMLVIGTRWSVHDPLTRLEEMYEGDNRFKSLKIPALDENGESNFDFVGGFDTDHYLEMKRVMDDLTFQAIYQQEPIEREGLLYHEEDLKYYLELPDEAPDTIVAVCDSKALGKDNVASPIGYVYGDTVYIHDIVYDNGLPEVTVPRVANAWVNNKVVRGDCEMNNGGNFFATGIDNKIKELGGKTSIRMFFTSQNKTTKIITYSDYITKQFIFRDSSTYAPNSDYARFMKDVFTWTQTGKNKFDDAPDSLAMLAQMVQELSGNDIKIMSRRQLGI